MNKLDEMFIVSEDNDILDFFDAIGFIPPEGKTIDYFISPTEVDVPQNSGFSLEQSAPTEVDQSQTYTRQAPVNKIVQADTPEAYFTYNFEPLPTKPIPPQPQFEDMTDKTHCPFVQVVQESAMLGTTIRLEEDFGPFKKNTLFHCI